MKEIPSLDTTAPVTVSCSWNVTPAQAMRIQEQLEPSVVSIDQLGNVRRVAGVDVHFPRRDLARAGVVGLDAETLRPLEQAVAELEVSFPYVPGLLSFREIPAAAEAIRRLRQPPDLLVCDGHGRAHPRRFGLACHLGVLLDVPTVGAAKNRLLGDHTLLPEERGSRVALRDDGDLVGMVLRTRSGVRPLYVSVGHRVSLETAVEWVLRCTPRYRLPETTRRAHALAAARPGEKREE